jgi:hypothetical protein
MNKNYKIHPAWLSGFIDGEGTFSVDILKNSTIALGYQVQLRFVLTQHIQDKELMYAIKDFLSCGTIVKDTDTKLQLRIRAIKDLEDKLFPILDKYPLQTKKHLDEMIFRQVFIMIKNKEHLTEDGLNKVRYLKSKINRRTNSYL